MFNGWFGIGRAYNKLPAHNNFQELAANFETLSQNLMDQAIFFGWQGAADKWQWRMARDIQMLLEYARTNVPEDADGPHYLSRPKTR
ncbi:MAG: hypothetical protein KGZ73_05300 [Rhizobiales bacterium]|nr:hypothetical protein [Hyphomicrobiales bacterium]